jgi:ketosteroid isomerase-like protein
MDSADAERFAQQWVHDWNAHDVEALLAHFRDDVVFTSPVAQRVLPGSDGVLRGKPALRQYWTRGLELIPDLRFEVVAVYTGVDTLVIHYRNQTGAQVAEVLTLDAAGLVVAGHGTYLSGANPAGVAPA